MTQPSRPLSGPRSRKGLTALALLALAGLTACGEEPARTEAVRPVRVVEATAQPLVGSESYAGEVVARTETLAAFQVGGRIVARLVDVGDRVEAGQVMARLDPQDYQLGLQAAEADLARAEANARQAGGELTRYRPLLERGVIAQAQFDRVKANADAAHALLEQARAGLQRARNDLSYVELRTEADGVVTAIRAETGQVVAPGQTVLAVAHSAERELEIDLPEDRIGDITVDTRAAVMLWTGGPELQARVREIAPAADPVTRTYRVRLSLAGAPDTARLGMTARARFAAGAGNAPVFKLPATALFQQGDSPAVWVMSETGDRVRLRPVEVAAYLNDAVAVRSGLTAGDLVVVAGVHRLDETLPVRVWDGGLP